MSRISNCHGSVLELCILPIQQQKNSIDCGIFAIAHAAEILHGENVENSSLDVILMRDHSLGCLQLQKFPPFPKTNKSVYRCRPVSFFFNMCCICREAYFYDDVKSDDKYFMANCNSVSNGTTRSAWRFQLKFFETFFPPRNLYQFHKFLVQSQNIIDENFSLNDLQKCAFAKRFTKIILHEHWHCHVKISL